MNNAGDFDQFDIFTLVGLSKAKPETKRRYLQQLGDLTVEEFLTQLVLKLNNTNQLKTINNFLKEKRPIAEVINYVNENLPDFYEELMDFVRQKKIEFIGNYFRRGIKDCQEKIEIALEKNLNEKIKINLKKQLDFYLKAEKLCQQQNWKDLKKIF